MARPLRIQAAGLSYHVNARGNGRMVIYRDACDHEKFLELLADMVEAHRVECHAYCMMTDHYHLVITTTDANLSKAIKQLNGTYGQWWNQRHGHVGHVFQGRFGAQVVQSEVYLLTVCKYVVLNPVRAHLVESPDKWRWSSYRASAGFDSAPSFLRPEMLWQILGVGDSAAAVLPFREFIGMPDEHGRVLRGVPVLGDAEFVERFQECRKHASSEVPRRETQILRPSLEKLFAGAVTRAARNIRAASAYAAGYSMADLARYLGLHCSTVSKMIATVSRGADRETSADSRPDPSGDLVSRGQT